MDMTKITPEKNKNEILDRINWLPRHMADATKEIKSSVRQVDIVIEVRDARVPIISGNKQIYDTGGSTPHLIVLNKTNLADPKAVKLWQEWFNEQSESFMFINALNKSSIKSIVRRAKQIIKDQLVKTNKTVSPKKETSVMILGLPNVGKSTIINKLSNRNATKAAATPGQTTVKLWVKVDNGMRILDTPGVMPTIIHEQEHAMWLSAIHAIPDHIITPEYSACFIVEHLLKTDASTLEKYYEIEAPAKDLISIVEHIGKRRGCLIAGGGFDYEYIYKIILNDFRNGSLGLTNFELPPVI
ncbi:MAG: ribosome biogenesis GTPase A [Thermoproteota archaeon]|jgi:ribosome biogenesis GTPase A